MARKGSSQADGTKGKAAKAAVGGEEKQGRLKQIRLVFGLTRKRDPSGNLSVNAGSTLLEASVFAAS